MIVHKTTDQGEKNIKISSEVFSSLPQNQLSMSRKYKKAYYMEYEEKLMMLDQVQHDIDKGKPHFKMLVDQYQPQEEDTYDFKKEWKTMKKNGKFMI